MRDDETAARTLVSVAGGSTRRRDRSLHAYFVARMPLLLLTPCAALYASCVANFFRRIPGGGA